MAQPNVVPVVEADQVRPSYQLEVPRAWTQSRPSELVGPQRTSGGRRGYPGPDQGYALKLAQRFVERLDLASGSETADVLAGAVAVAMRRSARFGRAPVIHDLTFALTLWGYLGDAPADLVVVRDRMFRSASHHYDAQRDIADAVGEDVLVMTPEEVGRRLDHWREFLNIPDDGDTTPPL